MCFFNNHLYINYLGLSKGKTTFWRPFSSIQEKGHWIYELKPKFYKIFLFNTGIGVEDLPLICRLIIVNMVLLLKILYIILHQQIWAHTLVSELFSI